MMIKVKADGQTPSAFVFLFLTHIPALIKARVEGVEVFAVQSVGCQAETLNEIIKSNKSLQPIEI